MKIIVKGTVVRFACISCGCTFVIGINSASTPDKGENYYTKCPVCGADCHANCTAVVK